MFGGMRKLYGKVLKLCKTHNLGKCQVKKPTRIIELAFLLRGIIFIDKRCNLIRQVAVVNQK
jgi:hypothetical protein